MLRSLVLLLLVVNAGLWYWLHDDAQALQSDREPQRLNHQVSPDAVQVLPDLPAASAPRGAGSAASAGAATASGPDVALATGPVAASAAASTAGPVAAALACAETPPLNDAEFATLKTALGKAGLPDTAIGERRQTKGGAWIVYMGRFPDADALQQKSAELRKLEVKFDRVNAPAALAPGLSLGQFGSQDEAARKMAELAKHGVHSARVAVLDAPIVLRHLQVRAGDATWRRAAVGQRFDVCPADAPSST
jgi:hypothetical protein